MPARLVILATSPRGLGSADPGAKNGGEYLRDGQGGFLLDEGGRRLLAR
jgi:hypothetical protein